MKRLRFVTAFFALMAVAGSAKTWAYHHGGHWHGHSHTHASVFIGVPLGAVTYYGSYYYPPVIVAPSPQIVYIEQGPAPQPPAPQASITPLPNGWWYYCPSPSGYYPYVKSCTRPWQPVEPRPPASPQ